jgi:hypothetical protein
MSDTWDTQANHRLRQHLMRGITRRRNYSPDTTLEQVKRGHAGPHSVQISAIFSRWARMWADDARAFPDGTLDELWRANMLEADAEVDRYLDANKLPRVA